MEDRRDEMVELQEKFRELYWNSGLIGVDTSDVMLDEDYFRLLFDDYKVIERDNDSGYAQYRVEAEYNGCIFYCLSDEA